MCLPNIIDSIKELTQPMNGENRPLVTYEPVEFEISPVEVQEFRKITDRFRGVYRIHLMLLKKNPKDVNM